MLDSTWLLKKWIFGWRAKISLKHVSDASFLSSDPSDLFILKMISNMCIPHVNSYRVSIVLCIPHVTSHLFVEQYRFHWRFDLFFVWSTVVEPCWTQVWTFTFLRSRFTWGPFFRMKFHPSETQKNIGAPFIGVTNLTPFMIGGPPCILEFMWDFSSLSWFGRLFIWLFNIFSVKMTTVLGLFPIPGETLLFDGRIDILGLINKVRPSL